MNQPVKKLIRKIHLWLGLASGLVVFLVSITGCIYVFEQEINQLLQTGVYRDVEPQDAPLLPPHALTEHILPHVDGEILRMNATLYPTGDRASVIWVRGEDRQYTAYLQNPYTGEAIHHFPCSINFWAVVLGIHTSLLIPEVGGQVVAAATLIFVIMLISGLILWFPKSKKGYKQRFRIKWGASPKRLNYDLHNVLGFYMTWILILVALTGLVWSYNWVEGAIYWVANGGETASSNASEEVQSLPSSEAANLTSTWHPVDKAFQTLVKQYDRPEEYFIDYPTDSLAPLLVNIRTEQGAFYNRHDSYLLDQYSGEVLQTNRWDDKNNGEVLREANYNIHTGAILGLPGKVLAFFASLVAASLPVTGFRIWWNATRWGRRKKRTASKVDAARKKKPKRRIITQ